MFHTLARSRSHAANRTERARRWLRDTRRDLPVMRMPRGGHDV
jgi:hypothetical protein